MLTPTALTTYREKLLALKSRLQGDVEELAAEARPPLAATAETYSESQDSPPAGAAMDLALLEHEKQLLAECDAALARIDGGTFGQCEDCRRPIPKRRLNVSPYTRHCVGCARLREGELIA